MPFDEAQARGALVAFGRYGKGLDPKARLNFADCAAYALATNLNSPLLVKGNDFTATDIQTAVRSIRSLSVRHGRDAAMSVKILNLRRTSGCGTVTAPLNLMDWAKLFGMATDRVGVPWLILALDQ